MFTFWNVLVVVKFVWRLLIGGKDLARNYNEFCPLSQSYDLINFKSQYVSKFRMYLKICIFLSAVIDTFQSNTV